MQGLEGFVRDWVSCACIGIGIDGMRLKLAGLAFLVLGAGAALAHSGVKNKVVLDRMDGMKALAESVGVLVGMAKGERSFDAGRAAEARDALARQAARVTEQFAARESDPKSEALPVIWSDWDGFVREAEALEAAVAALETGSLDAVRAGLGAVGKGCSGCHERFRLET